VSDPINVVARLVLGWVTVGRPITINHISRPIHRVIKKTVQNVFARTSSNFHQPR